MPAETTVTGSATACKETAKWVMMLVAWPITSRATKAPMMAGGSAKRITTGTGSQWTIPQPSQTRSGRDRPARLSGGTPLPSRAVRWRETQAEGEHGTRRAEVGARGTDTLAGGAGHGAQ